MDVLNKAIVLVLNRNWQAINIRTPQEAFCMMATNVGTALEIAFDDAADPEHLAPDASHLARASNIRPVTCDEWITLPIRPLDNTTHTHTLCLSRKNGRLVHHLLVEIVANRHGVFAKLDSVRNIGPECSRGSQFQTLGHPPLRPFCATDSTTVGRPLGLDSAES